MQTFVAAFDTLFGGFRQRAQKTYELLQAAGTSFLVVAAPETDAVREAAYFVERLEEERMPLAGLVVNRAGQLPPGGLSAEEAMAAADRLDRRSGSDTAPLTAGLLRLHAERARIVAREGRLAQRFTAAHPHVPTVVLPALPTDVHDLDGLRLIGDLFGSVPSRSASGPNREG
jgi:anion-transporting  ArsA/GET3 family ATPase